MSRFQKIVVLAVLMLGVVSVLVPMTAEANGCCHNYGCQHYCPHRCYHRPCYQPPCYEPTYCEPSYCEPCDETYCEPSCD